jgi:predicted dehydrogenase
MSFIGESSRLNSRKAVHIGILGCSDIAARKFVPALQRSGLATLSAVASRDVRKAASFIPGEHHKAMSYEEMVASTAVELLYISLPNDLHEAWVLRALESGKHVICEKPLGLEADAVERMLGAAAERNLLLYENIMFLHHPQHRAVRELVDAGRIGAVVSVRSVFGIPAPAKGNFRLDPVRGGGAFHDLARYPLATALYFLQGTIGEIKGYRVDRGDLNMGMSGLANSSEDELFTFSLAFGQEYESYYEIVGEKGKIRLDRAYTTPADLANRVTVTCSGRDESFMVPPDDHFRLMIDHVCMRIRRGGPFLEEHAFTRRLARLAELMTKGCTHGS